ncbi:CPCC family cysteine-rich protein [Neobacillus bataviensis]|nr:CPCC family cysteine-rich protein [Neobacillus bataviensis]
MLKFYNSSKGDYDICPICFWEDDPLSKRKCV